MKKKKKNLDPTTETKFQQKNRDFCVVPTSTQTSPANSEEKNVKDEMKVNMYLNKELPMQTTHIKTVQKEKLQHAGHEDMQVKIIDNNYSKAFPVEHFTCCNNLK